MSRIARSGIAKRSSRELPSPVLHCRGDRWASISCKQRFAAVHDEAARADETDWPQILALYDMLMRITENPMVALNHAIATAMVDGPDAGLGLLVPLQNDERLRGNHRSMPCEPTCWSGPVSSARRRRFTAKPPRRRQVCRSGNTC